MLRIPRFARLAWLLATAPLAAAGDPLPAVRIETPGADAVLLAPSVAVRVRFHPRLLPHESVRVHLTAGLDGVEGPRELDLGPGLALSRRGGEGWLRLSQLPPGRSRLRVERSGPGRGRGASRARFAGAAELGLDRGGFFPDAEGPFAAGVRRSALLRLRDDGAPRVLELLVWYPTDEIGASDPDLQGRLDARLPPRARELPALLFSHGNCGLPDNYARLLSRLARAGWLALAMTHPGNTRDDPGCDSLAAQIDAFLQRPADVRASLDWLLLESADPGSPLAGAVDPARIALAGHSFGALTTLLTAPQEPRLRALLPLAPVFAPVAALLRPSLPLDLPVMLQVGSLDTTTPPASHAAALYQELIAPRFLLELSGAGHAVFEDVCATPQPGVCPPGAHDAIARLALGFLGSSVAGDLRWAELLVSGPGAALRADP